MHSIFDVFLTLRESAQALPCSRNMYKVVSKTLGLQNILPLLSQGFTKISIVNPPAPDGTPFSKYSPPLRFSCFNYDPSSTHLITGDNGSGKRTKVRVWDRVGKLVSELQGDFLHSVRSVQLDMQSKRALASASSNDDSSVKLWDLTTGNLLYGKRPFSVSNPSAVCTGLNMGSILCGASNGRIQSINPAFPGDRIKSPFFGEEDGSRVTWICDAAQSDRVFSCNTENVLKIWDRNTRTCLSTRKEVASESEKLFYAASENRLFVGASKRYVHEFNASTGVLCKVYEVSDETATLFTWHYDSVKKWIFAGFYCKVAEATKTKIVVWEQKTSKVLYTFIISVAKGNRYPLKQIDFDPISNTLLTAGRGVQLWRLSNATGKLLAVISKDGDARVKWDRNNALLAIFKKYRDESDPESGTLTLLDYSNPSLQKPKAREESKEFKEGKGE